MKARILSLLFSALLVSSVGHAGPLEDAVAAHERGDYGRALQLLRPLAQEGSTPAFYLLGLMYANGRGVPQDYKEAVAWYQKAAEQGFAPAQLNLGLMYDNGQGVLKTQVLAYLLYSCAVAAGNTRANHNRDNMVGGLTPVQLNEPKTAVVPNLNTLAVVSGPGSRRVKPSI